jgi:hypothetical protein
MWPRLSNRCCRSDPAVHCMTRLEDFLIRFSILPKLIFKSLKHITLLLGSSLIVSSLKSLRLPTQA